MKGMELRIPGGLAASCHKTQERTAWLERLPNVLRNLEHRWSLTLDAPFNDDEVSCSYVAAAVRADGTPAILKIGMPHMEGADEIHGLRFWNGDPTVQLLEADDEQRAMLLERCLPGYMLRSEPEEKQDLVIAALLKRLWRTSTSLNGSHAFRHLSELLNVWRQETLDQAQHWPDAGLVREGLQIFEALGKPAPTDT